MQVEHVTRVGLATRRATKQQRNLAIRLGLLGEVVVHDEGVLALFHPVLTHRASGVWRQVLERCGVARWRRNHHGVFHRAVLTQRLHGLGNGRTLLTDCHVNALHTQTLLVEDGVDGNGGLAGFAVADDQFALSATNRGHRVDGLDARLQRLVHGLATHDARGLNFHATHLCASDVTLAIDWHTECVHDATEHGVPNGNRQDSARGLHRLLLFDAVSVAQHNDADGIFVEVQRQTHAAVFKLEQLVHCAVWQATDACDTVTDFRYATDGASFHRWRVALETLGDCCRNV